ncbi:MAG: DNA mismatch repair protein MutS [Firmicutes bacterium]|nr:DNA mismatch repair protein MutS [Bacillota bacterium]
MPEPPDGKAAEALAASGRALAGAAAAEEIPSESLTPMLEQYYRVKQQVPDALVFFRLGDFYEMFGEDAEIGSRLLDIVLTGRDAGKAGRVPMCGIPHHAAESYLARLVRAGYKVAICEQLEDPKKAKGLVRRDVIRVVSPGTLLEEELLEAAAHNYLAAVLPSWAQGTALPETGTGSVRAPEALGLAYADLSTGDFAFAQFGGEDGEAALAEELARLEPSELLYPEPCQAWQEAFVQQYPAMQAAAGGPLRWSARPAADFDLQRSRQALSAHFGAEAEGLGWPEVPWGLAAAGALWAYLAATHLAGLGHLRLPQHQPPRQFMLLDPASRRHLEISRTARDGSRQGSLLWVLDATVTAMGARQLRSWLDQPLLSPQKINQRLDAVQEWVEDPLGRRELRQRLRAVRDLERLSARINCGLATPRDLVALRESLAGLPALRDRLSTTVHSALLRRLAEQLDPLDDLHDLLSRALVPDPPANAHDGGIIAPGFSAEIDELRQARDQGKQWIASLEAAERERTGIRSLRVGYNKVFGYYIEVTRANRDLVPASYERRQTLANAERYVTPELKEHESRILAAAEHLADLEYEAFQRLREEAVSRTPRLQQTAGALAQLDALASLAEVASRYGYVRPVVDLGQVIEIRQGRHPVVERLLRDRSFVPNDCLLDGETQRFLLITGPNMAGKSTYLRQVALITLMAQAGSFVPAASAHIGVVDRIFTRIGAADDLGAGLSTFMVEMQEVAYILRHATPRSLVLLDEVGRGTSTYDGLSLAWALTEALHDPGQVGAKTLFATHYHELVRLADTLPAARNFNVGARRSPQGLAFLYQLQPGGSDESYGIEVAGLAGVPEPVLRRARQVLSQLEAGRTIKVRAETPGVAKPAPAEDWAQPSLFSTAPPRPSAVVRRLADLDLDGLTPRQALELLYELREAARSEVGGKPAGRPEA